MDRYIFLQKNQTYDKRKTFQESSFNNDQALFHSILIDLVQSHFCPVSLKFLSAAHIKPSVKDKVCKKPFRDSIYIFVFPVFHTVSYQTSLSFSHDLLTSRGMKEV